MKILLRMGVRVCVGVNVPYHTVKYTFYHESQSKRFEKGCSSQTELTASLLCSVLTERSPQAPSRLHGPPSHPPPPPASCHPNLAHWSRPS